VVWPGDGAGDTDAINNLGVMSESGTGGLDKNLAEALDWYLKAASLGNENGRENRDWLRAFLLAEGPAP
jgi:TPR repeat protein